MGGTSGSKRPSGSKSELDMLEEGLMGRLGSE
jgi:hypothetical protein